ncbi:uncharacterized protein [Palaemon carinicauda]|uniref:uncharacterized protein n=1 Tax=Palaemon carinicauda TaxID=392227 RepID=UPI0035B5F478
MEYINQQTEETRRKEGNFFPPSKPIHGDLISRWRLFCVDEIIQDCDDLSPEEKKGMIIRRGFNQTNQYEIFINTVLEKDDKDIKAIPLKLIYLRFQCCTDDPLILKTYKWDFIKGFGWKGMFWEADVLRKLERVRGTPKLIAVDPFSHQNAMIMTDCGTTTFKRWVRKNAGDALKQVRLLVKVSGILREIHALGISHNDLHIENIIIDEATDEPSIIDFGGSMPFGQRSWRTLFLPCVPFLQLVCIKPIDQFVDIRNFDRLMRFAEHQMRLDGPAMVAYRDLYKDCRTGKVKSAEELHKRILAIAVMLEEKETTRTEND